MLGTILSTLHKFVYLILKIMYKTGAIIIFQK